MNGLNPSKVTMLQQAFSDFQKALAECGTGDYKEKQRQEAGDIPADYTATEAAKILGCTPQKIRTMARDGLIPSYCIGKRGLRIPREGLNKFRNAQ